jgi:hypothetical protein
LKFLNIPYNFLLGGCLPATYCTEYGFKRMKEEQGLVIQQKKSMDAAGFEPMDSM